MTTTVVDISLVRAFVALQRRLVDALRLANPAARDFRFMFNFPKTGEVTVEGEPWRFDRHGAGVAFTSTSGVIVDVHRGFEQPDVVDAWRLVRYLETSGAVGGDKLDETEVDAELRVLAQHGQLKPVDSSGGYRP